MIPPQLGLNRVETVPVIDNHSQNLDAKSNSVRILSSIIGQGGSLGIEMIVPEVRRPVSNGSGQPYSQDS